MGNSGTKKLTLFLTLAITSIVLMVVGAILNWEAVTRDERVYRELYDAYDMGLFLIVPLFLVSLFFAARGGYRTILVILGLLTYPIYAMFREAAFAHEHLFIIFFVVSASCAFYAIIVGAGIVKERAPGIHKWHDRLAMGIVCFFVYSILLYILGFVICIKSIWYPRVVVLLYLFGSNSIITGGILLPFLIYTIVLLLKKRWNGFILAPVLIIASILIPLSVSTYRDFDSLIWLIAISSCMLFSLLLFIPILFVLPKGTTSQHHGNGKK